MSARRRGDPFHIPNSQFIIAFVREIRPPSAPRPAPSGAAIQTTSRRDRARGGATPAEEPQPRIASRAEDVRRAGPRQRHHPHQIRRIAEHRSRTAARHRPADEPAGSRKDRDVVKQDEEEPDEGPDAERDARRVDAAARAAAIDTNTIASTTDAATKSAKPAMPTTPLPAAMTTTPAPRPPATAVPSAANSPSQRPPEPSHAQPAERRGKVGRRGRPPGPKGQGPAPRAHQDQHDRHQRHRRAREAVGAGQIVCGAGRVGGRAASRANASVSSHSHLRRIAATNSSCAMVDVVIATVLPVEPARKRREASRASRRRLARDAKATRPDPIAVRAPDGFAYTAAAASSQPPSFTRTKDARQRPVSASRPPGTRRRRRTACRLRRRRSAPRPDRSRGASGSARLSAIERQRLRPRRPRRAAGRRRRDRHKSAPMTVVLMIIFPDVALEHPLAAPRPCGFTGPVGLNPPVAQQRDARREAAHVGRECVVNSNVRPSRASGVARSKRSRDAAGSR